MPPARASSARRGSGPALKATSGPRTQASGKQKLLNREEEHAFWAWAVIEVLRFTGLRVEELLELSHYSLVKYRLPTTGEVVPLLQIAPSKTDTERLLVVSPELADVLSEVIRRVRGPDGAVRLVRAWDYHERVWLPPSPLLFQHRVGPEHKEFNIPFVSTLINDALARTAFVGADGQPVRFTPHDFRRMFITDAVMNGLPPHIAQVIAGHHDLNVTMGYKAVYPDEALQAHLAFLARRRALRPSEEYRSPTDEEWQAFFGHFERRKVSVGTCGRAFETPCIHEHACVRCALLWPDPSPARTPRRDPRQPRRPDSRSHARGMARRSRGAGGQPGRRRRQARPTGAKSRSARRRKLGRKQHSANTRARANDSHLTMAILVKRTRAASPMSWPWATRGAAGRPWTRPTPRPPARRNRGGRMAAAAKAVELGYGIEADPGPSAGRLGHRRYTRGGLGSPRQPLSPDRPGRRTWCLLPVPFGGCPGHPRPQGPRQGRGPRWALAGRTGQAGYPPLELASAVERAGLATSPRAWR